MKGNSFDAPNGEAERLATMQQRIVEFDSRIDKHWEQLVEKFTAAQIDSLSKAVNDLSAVMNELQTELKMFRDARANDTLISTREASQVLNVHRHTIHRWAKSGALPSKKIGRGFRFYKSDLLKLA